MKTKASTYTIAELRAATSLKGFGKIKTGSTDAVRYVEVRVDDGDHYPVALIVTYFGRKPSIINDSALISQFLYRGC
jgi:hypothetical protein